MEPLIMAGVAALTVGATALAIWWERRRAAQRRERLLATARTLGLTFHPRRGKKHEMFAGVFEGVPVEVKLERTVVSTGKSVIVILKTHFEAQVPGCGLAISAEGIGTSLRKLFTGRDIPIGDPAFDATAFVKGDEREALARLGPEARDAVAAVLARKGGVKNGIASVVISGHAETPDDVLAVLRPVVQAAAALALRDRSVPASLLDAVRSDEPRRRRALELLVRHDPDAPETAEASRLLRNSPDPFIRIHAALGLGDLDTARALVADETLPEETRALAVDRLRAGGSAAGGLSVAEPAPDAGALSEAEGEGNLSLARQAKPKPTTT